VSLNPSHLSCWRWTYRAQGKHTNRADLRDELAPSVRPLVMHGHRRRVISCVARRRLFGCFPFFIAAAMPAGGHGGQQSRGQLGNSRLLVFPQHDNVTSLAEESRNAIPVWPNASRSKTVQAAMAQSLTETASLKPRGPDSVKLPVPSEALSRNARGLVASPHSSRLSTR
jgi:hypothetical protein